MEKGKIWSVEEKKKKGGEEETIGGEKYKENGKGKAGQYLAK